jgi:hypothetical protein
VLILLTLAAGAWQDGRTFSAESTPGSFSLLKQQVANDLRAATAPGQLVVTDEQFIAGLAGRDVPPQLVDTSMVRIVSGYLTLPQLIAASSSPQVHVVLFFSGRFSLAPVRGYHVWVAGHFRLLRNYGNGMELWVR